MGLHRGYRSAAPPGGSALDDVHRARQRTPAGLVDSGHEDRHAEPLERLARDGELSAYRHHGFWQCMDHMRDKLVLEDLWASGAAPWKVW